MHPTPRRPDRPAPVAASTVLPTGPLTRRSALLLVPAGIIALASQALANDVVRPVAGAAREAFDLAGDLARSIFPAPSERTDTSSRAALSRAVLAELGGRSDVIGVSVLDRRTGVWWHYRGDAAVRSGSVSKVLVVAAAMRKARNQGGRLSARQQGQARLAITKSDNASADALYAFVGGHAAVAELARDLGMATTADAEPVTHWGLTRTTPNDLVRLVQRLTSGSPATHPEDDAAVLALMRQVIDGQRWGVGTVRSDTVDVHVKNGWMAVGEPWVINSVGDVRGAGRDYAMALMQTRQPDQDSGIGRASRIGRAVFGALEAPLR
ncbi:MAG TPA: serine hydrolase [Intrasporangium sp.]|nr:serine hydrolase [Intrasporangium sp.]